MALAVKLFNDNFEQTKTNIHRGLSIQERVYEILEGLDIAVIEIEPIKRTIRYCNKEGNKILRSIYRKLHPLTRFPDLLVKNDFLKLTGTH